MRRREIPQINDDADITEIVEVLDIELDEYEDEMYRRLSGRDNSRMVRKMRAPRDDYAVRQKNKTRSRRAIRQLKEATV